MKYSRKITAINGAIAGDINQVNIRYIYVIRPTPAIRIVAEEANKPEAPVEQPAEAPKKAPAEVIPLTKPDLPSETPSQGHSTVSRREV